MSDIKSQGLTSTESKLSFPLQAWDNIQESFYACNIEGHLVYANQYAKHRMENISEIHSVFDLLPRLTQKRWEIAVQSAIDKDHWIIQIPQSEQHTAKQNGRRFLELRISHQIFESNDLFIILTREVSKLGQSDELLNLIAQASAELSGKDFFKMLVKQMATVMHVDKAFITECLDQPPTQVRMLASWDRNDFSKNLEYELSVTPCDKVINGRQDYYVEQKLGEIYPIEKDVAESYYGVPIYDNDETHVIGHIALLDDNLVPIDGLDCTIFEILAARASVELQRLHIQDALNKSEVNYKLLVENQTDLILRLDKNAKLTFVSPSCNLRMDKKEHELIGSEFFSLIHKDEREAVQQAWRMSFIPPYKTSCELRSLTSQGWSWFAWVFKGVIDDAQEIVEIIAVGRDISARIRAEDQARDTIAKLAHVGRVSSMGEMASGIAHELNQPLTAILSFAQASQNMLASSSADLDEYRSILNRIAKNAELAGKIIQRVQGFVKKTEPNKSSIDLAQVINEINGLLETNLRQNKIKLLIELDGNLPLVFGDLIQVQQVLLNLVKNAIESIVDNNSTIRQIIVSTESLNQNQVAVKICDTGTGIPVEISEQLFDAFVTTKTDGLGIGLSICQSIIEAHGGIISSVTNDQGGATFMFSLESVVNEN